MVRMPLILSSLVSGSVRPLIFRQRILFFLLQFVFIIFSIIIAFIIIFLFHTFSCIYFHVRPFYSSLVKDCRLAIESSIIVLPWLLVHILNVKISYLAKFAI